MSRLFVLLTRSQYLQEPSAYTGIPILWTYSDLSLICACASRPVKSCADSPKHSLRSRVNGVGVSPESRTSTLMKQHTNEALY